MSKSKRGFASLSKERRREIALAGNRKVHALGLAHKFTREEAAAAGRKGGLAAHRSGNGHKFTPEELREAHSKAGRPRKQKETNDSSDKT